VRVAKTVSGVIIFTGVVNLTRTPSSTLETAAPTNNYID